METIDELKKWLNEIGNHYSALKELNQFTDYDGYIYSTYETVRKKIDELEKAKIFLQPDVSINEGLQLENKKVPEVTVLPADSYSKNQVINILGRYTSYVYDNRNKVGGLSVYYPFAKDWFNKNVKAGKTGC